MVLNQRCWQSLGGQHGKGVHGLVEKLSFQTAFERVKSGWKSDIKRQSIPDCSSQVTKRSFTKFGVKSGYVEENLWTVGCNELHVVAAVCKMLQPKVGSVEQKLSNNGTA